MRDKFIKFFAFVQYWMIILLPFSVAVAPAPMNVFMGWLLFSFLMKKILKRENPVVPSRINLAFVLLMAISVISIINSVSLKDSLKGGILRLLQYGFIYLAVIDGIKDARHIRRIFISLVLGVCFISFDGIWQVVTGKDFVRGYLPIINLNLVRATASFKDANVMGIYLSAFIPLMLCLAFYFFKDKKKILMFFISLLALAGLVLTYSRPSLLAVYLSVLFLGLVKKDKIVIAALLGLVVLAPFIAPRSVKDWAKEVNYNPIRFMCNDDRIAIYRNDLQMVKAHPAIGVGTNNFMKNYKKYKESPEYMNIVTADYMYAHNNFLHMAGETGLIGLGIFLWLLYRLFAEASGIYKRLEDNFFKFVSLGLIASLIAFLLNGLTESSLYYSRVAVLFWYLTGFSLGLKKFINADR
ncbi:MAG: O-antigen ligase family protein [Candidatus Omnitrophica bacterium]|nr:O-antigen ligase family protein [Candidatus Omnitrophota bacterium]MDD5236615.1 O-antigen ligase family protein [Candidatus Omnitrophota bacterium]MDD5610186.1 O-antigen ligase family protein [Candidatus Omnitrophota bacterium]